MRIADLAVSLTAPALQFVSGVDYGRLRERRQSETFLHDHNKFGPNYNRIMSSTTISLPASNTTKEPEKKLKPCCACPETKKARDAWYVKLTVSLNVYMTCTNFVNISQQKKCVEYAKHQMVTVQSIKSP